MTTLDELEKLLADATTDPWDSDGVLIAGPFNRAAIMVAQHNIAGGRDASAIVALRNAAPTLIALARRANGLAAELSDVLAGKDAIGDRLCAALGLPARPLSQAAEEACARLASPSLASALSALLARFPISRATSAEDEKAIHDAEEAIGRIT